MKVVILPTSCESFSSRIIHVWGINQLSPDSLGKAPSGERKSLPIFYTARTLRQAIFIRFVPQDRFL